MYGCYEYSMYGYMNILYREYNSKYYNKYNRSKAFLEIKLRNKTNTTQNDTAKHNCSDRNDWIEYYNWCNLAIKRLKPRQL